MNYMTTMIINPEVFAKQSLADRSGAVKSISGPAARRLTALWSGSGFLIDPADALVSGAFFSLHHAADGHRPNDAVDRLEMTETIVIGSTAVVSTSLSVGYVIWIIRGGSLLSAFMSAMPAWQNFDPLPILQSFEKAAQEDDESLLGIVTRKGVAPLRGKTQPSSNVD